MDDQQALAVGAVLQRDLVLLSGGAGTGKTRTIVKMLAAYIQEYPNHLIALAAPTGDSFPDAGIGASVSEIDRTV